MSKLELSAREWHILRVMQEFFGNVPQSLREVDGQPATDAELSYIYERILEAEKADLPRIQQENEENTRHFAFEDEKCEREFCERRTKYGIPYSGEERRHPEWQGFKHPRDHG
jgi:hypothetical protein